MKKRPQDQTNEEWLADWENTIPNQSIEERARSKSRNISANNITQYPIEQDHEILFEFYEFRTTRKKAVALEFISLDGRIKATSFFGVYLRSKRNFYPVGSRGQFIPPLKGNFVEFWMRVVGKAPERWCRVHKSLHSQLKGEIFTGEIVKCKDEKGREYNKLLNLRLHEQALIRH